MARSTSSGSCACITACISATLGGSSPRALRSSGARTRSPPSAGAWRLGDLVMSVRPSKNTLPVPSIDRTPVVLVGLPTAQEVELARSFTHGRFNSMADDDRARAFESIGWIKTRQVPVGTIAMHEAKIDSCYLARDRQRIESRHGNVHQSLGGGEKKPTHASVGQDAGLTAVAPAKAMQPYQDSNRCGAIRVFAGNDLDRPAACRAVARRAERSEFVGRQYLPQLFDTIRQQQHGTCTDGAIRLDAVARTDETAGSGGRCQFGEFTRIPARAEVDDAPHQGVRDIRLFVIDQHVEVVAERNSDGQEPAAQRPDLAIERGQSDEPPTPTRCNHAKHARCKRVPPGKKPRWRLERGGGGAAMPQVPPFRLQCGKCLRIGDFIDRQGSHAASISLRGLAPANIA